MQPTTVSNDRGRTIHVGCSGWVYKHWRGLLYPEGLPQKRWFERYAEEFDTVEINASFYRLPLASTFEGWRDKAPPGFRYAPQGPRAVARVPLATAQRPRAGRRVPPQELVRRGGAGFARSPWRRVCRARP